MSGDRGQSLLRPDRVGLTTYPSLRVPGQFPVVQTVWLLGSGHTAIDRDWSEALRTECEQLSGASMPHAALEAYVPDKDHLGRHIDGRKFAEGLRIGAEGALKAG